MKYYKKFTLNCQQGWKVMPWGSGEDAAIEMGLHRDEQKSCGTTTPTGFVATFNVYSAKNKSIGNVFQIEKLDCMLNSHDNVKAEPQSMTGVQPGWNGD